MALRMGPGPVFVHESIVATRRWQLYALRSLFVLGLLVALLLAWMSVQSQYGKGGGELPIRGLAAMGQSFYIAIATVQLALVLIIAPGATAATICQDRARGTLTHMLVTDLTSSEIVLGKLAARLAPVVSLVAATIPVLALAGLLGGVVIEAIVALTLITLVLAIFGCTLALAISVRASKTHEVLMAVYGIEAVWVLAPLIWMILEETGLIRSGAGLALGRQPILSGDGSVPLAGRCERIGPLCPPGRGAGTLGRSDGLCGAPAAVRCHRPVRLRNQPALGLAAPGPCAAVRVAAGTVAG